MRTPGGDVMDGKKYFFFFRVNRSLLKGELDSIKPSSKERLVGGQLQGSYEVCH